jgi:hypothetical protein
MKMIILIIAIALIMTSCYDETIVDPTKVESKLTVTVYGNDNLPVKYAKVKIRTEYGNEGYIFDDSTDIDGKLSVLLLEGNYFVEAKINTGKVYFFDSKYLQIIGGINKSSELRPYKNIGDIERVIWDSKHKPIPGINVTLLTKVLNYTTTYTFEYCSEFAYITTVSDTKGMVTFKNVPKGYVFGVLLYKDESLYEYYTHEVSVESKDYVIYTNFK